MRIKEIELDNFKSFGKLTTVPILPGFTVISGPNGSGKSNIVDSLMFALGLTTTRNMRAEKLTDLLNNLTGRKECTVKVTFVDDDNDEETVVQRRIRVKENGYDSKYFLNGETSTLTQIHEELGKKNISPHGYNVVMQGDVASIISMNAVERRKIIDEIAGVAEFDRKIELAEKELEIVQERIDSQELILGEITDRLKQLQNERDQAIKYAELRERRTALERQFLTVRIKQLEDDEAKANEELESLQKKKTDLQVENNTLNEEMHKFQEEIKELNEQINKLGEGRQREIGIELDEKKSILAKVESEIEYINKQISDQDEEQKKLQKEIKKTKEALKEISVKESEFREEMKVIEQNIKEEEEKYKAVQEKIRKKSESSNLSSRAVVDAQEKISALKEDKAKLEQEKVKLEENITYKRADLERTKEAAEEALDKLNAIRLEYGEDGALKFDALKEQADFQEKSIVALKDEIKDTRGEISKQELKLSKIQRELDKLEGQEQAANEAGYGRAVESILDMEGVHGTLAQLGAVENQYQTAVETAAGTRLRAVVVDDDYVATECINELRSKKAGRATFLPLNKLREARQHPLPKDKGVIDWAINLVNFDEQYRDAFGYAFADTLVVKTIEHARKMIGRYRMVTLNGDLIERSGAMTGGAAVKSNIHFGTNVENSRNKLEMEKIQQEGFIKELREELENLENQVEEAKAKKEKLKEEFTKKEASYSANTGQIKSLEESYDKNKEALETGGKELNDIEEKLEVQNDKIGAKQKVIDREEGKLQELAEEMKDSGLEALITEGQDIEVEIKRYQTMMNNLINESKSLEVEKNFSEQNIDKFQAEIEESKLEVEELNGKIPEIQAKKDEINEEVEKLNAEFEKIRESISGYQAKRDTISEQLMKMGERKGEITSGIENTAIKIVETRKKIEELSEHLTQLREELKEHPELLEVQIEEENISKLQAELNRIEKKMRSMEPVNMRAVEEYEEVSKREGDIIERLESLANEKETITTRIDGFSNDKKTAFMGSFDKIDTYFQEIFADLSFGNGQLILEDPEDIFKGGLVIKAQPRGKKMQRLEAMSGGEKSLTALSFLFALQQHNPAPFYAFDEVDSALDGVNVDRIAHKVRNNSHDTQFIVVTHRRPMLDQADRAVGVSVGRNGFSRVLGVQNIEHLEDMPEKEPVAA